MPSAEILTIGTELLLGEIVDTNTQYLARQLRDAGIDLYRTSTVGDNETRIAEAVQHSLGRADIVLCTGGLGPTVDDVTRESIARALGVELEYKEELWQQIQKRFSSFGRTASENNKRQAFVPKGAQVLDNAVGSAPAFMAEQGKKIVIAMPGVPAEMSYILEHEVFPILRERFGPLPVIFSRVLKVAGVGESVIDEKIADLEKLENPTVGLAAHAGSVDVRLTAKAANDKQAKQMLDDLETQVRQRLGTWIYGSDKESLAAIILADLAARGKRLAVIEKGLQGALVKAFTGEGTAFVGGEILNSGIGKHSIKELTEKYSKEVRADIILGTELRGSDNKHELEISVLGFERPHNYSFSYGGHSDQAPGWAVNLALSALRKQLLERAPAKQTQ
jgi:nicotinamide-nucleotide amidase